MSRARLVFARCIVVIALTTGALAAAAEGTAPTGTPRDERAVSVPVPPRVPLAQGTNAVDARPAWRLGRSPSAASAPAGVRAGVVFDLRSGRVLWERHGASALPVASLTKVMTALLVVERLSPAARVRIPSAALRVRGSHSGLPRAGHLARTEDLLRGLLLASGNDAAVALAVRAAGSERAFVTKMNRRARRWGLRCTRFVSVHGLGAANRVCPRDLAVLTRRAMRMPRIARIVRRPSARARLGPGGSTVTLRSTNPLLHAGERGVLGLKTGWAPYAGRCLIAVVRRDGRRLGIVLLDAPDRVSTVRTLLARVRARTRR